MGHYSNNDGWLKNLKPGDEVALCTGSSREFTVAQVTKITKLHVIIGATKFKLLNGFRVGDSGFNQARIVPLTDAIHEDIRRRALLRKIVLVKWDTVSTPQLEKVLGLLANQEDSEQVKK